MNRDFLGSGSSSNLNFGFFNNDSKKGFYFEIKFYEDETEGRINVNVTDNGLSKDFEFRIVKADIKEISELLSKYVKETR